MLGLAPFPAFLINQILFLIFEGDRSHFVVSGAAILPDEDAKVGSFRLNVTFDCDVVDFGYETGLIGVGVAVGMADLKGEGRLSELLLGVLQRILYFLHVNDSVDLISVQIGQPILTARPYFFLIHLQFLPILRKILLFGPLEDRVALRLEGSRVDLDEVGRQVIQVAGLLLHDIFICYLRADCYIYCVNVRIGRK